MLDLKFIRKNVELVRATIKNKNEKADLDELLHLDEERKRLIAKADKLKAIRNEVSQKIGKLKKTGKDAEDKVLEMRKLGDDIKNLDEQLKSIEEKIYQIQIWIPNIIDESVPIGDESKNETIKEWGTPKKEKDFGFKPREHWDLVSALDIIDFERAGKITGCRCVFYKGLCAKLERALINWMLDLHTEEHNYKEISPPFIVNRDSMFGTGQLPKLKDDMYYCEVDDFFLIPTAEVPITNIHRNEILKEKQLPLYYTAYTPCFRREAGSYGKETRGLNRVHQFDKVELVKLVEPDKSWDELESLLANAEKVLQLLNLPYRVCVLASGDLSFAASKCYDIEVWAPGANKWLEVSSCSNFLDFQARRSNIKYRSKNSKKAQYVHTLNGSGLALPRTVIAILENYQEENGVVIIPEVLRPYMNGLEKIEKKY